MAIEEIQQLFAQFKDYMQGANFFAPIIINLTSDSASNVVNCADVAEKKEPEQQNIDEEVSQALREITGEHKPIDSKQKWAGAYWYLRWAYNFPVDVQEFCNKIQALGIFLPPKSSRTTNRMTTISVVPIKRNGIFITMVFM